MKINLQIQRTQNPKTQNHTAQVNHPLVQNVVAADKVLLTGTVKEYIITVNKEKDNAY